jgi:DNA-binding GntR family transcriptional regulator
VVTARAQQHTAVSIREDLELQILTGRRQPHERLIEDDLMDVYDAKRHVVRQALQELEYRELVNRVPKVGSFVRAYDSRQIADLYDVRILLEMSAVQRIPLPVDPVALAELKEIQAAHDRAVADQDVRATVEANMTFHERLFGLCDNTFLVDAVRRHARMTYSVRSVTVTNPSYRVNSAGEHRQMLEALEQGDVDRLADLCRQHLLPSRNLYLQMIGHH